MQNQTDVFILSIGRPKSVSAIIDLMMDSLFDPQKIVTTDGNGCVNDLTSDYATQYVRAFLTQYLSPNDIVQNLLMMSGVAKGRLLPYWMVLSQSSRAASNGPTLAMSEMLPRTLDTRKIVRKTQSELVYNSVQLAKVKADPTDSKDVPFGKSNAYIRPLSGWPTSVAIRRPLIC
jgi:hypothetical protein